MKTYRRNRSRGARLVGSMLGLVGVTACGTSQDVAAETAARDLVTAVAQRDGDAACALLAPEARDELERSSGEPCVRAVMAEDLPTDRDPESTHVFDTMAQVRFASGPVFLARFDGTWLVIGAACTPVPDLPYDCSIQVS